MNRIATTRWVAILVLLAWWILEIRSDVQIALSPFTLVGDVPPAVRTWTIIAAVLVQLGDLLPMALPLIVAAAASIRATTGRRVLAVVLLFACILATNWLRPAADLQADRSMPGSVAQAPPQDSRLFTSIQLLEAIEHAPTGSYLANVNSAVLSMRIACVLAVLVLLVPLAMLRGPVSLRWYVGPAGSLACIGLNQAAFMLLSPRMASPWSSLIWILGPAVAISFGLVLVLRRAERGSLVRGSDETRTPGCDA